MKKKRLISIIIELIIMIICLFVIRTNNDFNILFNKKRITNKDTFKKYNNYKYISFDLENAKEERFSVSDNDETIGTFYTLKYDDTIVLIELSNGSVATNSVDLIKKKDISYTREVKDSIIDESKDVIKFYEGYYTNINLKQNLDILKIKLYGLYFICSLSFIFMIIDFLKIINIHGGKNEDRRF